MVKLTEKEEEIMRIIWERGPSFVKEVRSSYKDPKPHINTISTTMRKMVDKDILKVESFGSTHRYLPLFTKEEYTSSILHPRIKRLFGNSYKNVVAHFAQEEDLSVEDLKDIIRMIENNESK